ncbi:hypothetical protein, partial [Cloacibacillus porcorum]|uniref:hypothetical protein n=1 Tax=Cloacibacillus porcorum TaxID=1197717 RepID=UPI003F10DD3D
MEVIKSDFVLVCHAGLAPASSGFAMLLRLIMQDKNKAEPTLIRAEDFARQGRRRYIQLPHIPITISRRSPGPNR